MKHDRLKDVSHALGAPAPAALAALETAALRTLTDALHDARRKQRRQMAEATDSALQHIPFLLRGAVKKVLGIP